MEISMTHLQRQLERASAERQQKMAVQRAARESAEVLRPAPQRRVKAATPWYDDVLEVVREINRLYFSLSEVYEYTDRLSERHPGLADDTVQSHTRHQLQQLRNAGILFFFDDGTY